MKKQIIVIHGGDAFDTYKEYIADLRREEFKLRDVQPKSWRRLLPTRLGKGFQVIMPLMPNKDDARYLEWKIWFNKIIPHLKGEIVLIGHSLGGIFLAKYLSEIRFPRKLKAVFLVAPTWNARDTGKSLADFVLPRDMSRLERLGEKVHIYQSEDDPIVDFWNVKKYIKALPKAKVTIFKDRGHFVSPQFPELVRDIKALYEKR
jgi:predicted alpha/beta hydrolase family esterase